MSWRDIESSPGQFQWDLCDQHIQWCQEQGWRILGGPLLSLSRANLPDWIYLWEDDPEHLQSCVYQFLRAAVQRYRGKFHVWHCAAGINVEGALSLSEEQRLRLVVGAIEEVRRADPHTPLLVSFDQPWAEYLASSALELSPLHFADSLIRADLGIAGFGLELNIGYWPGGTLPRDRLEISRQLDRWSSLGLPLMVFLSLPSGSAPVPHARLAPGPPGAASIDVSPEGQSNRGARLLPLLLAKHFVQGVFWSQLSDDQLGELAHGGLFDDASQPKPVLDVWAANREQHLQ
jgi:hypothetical protein